MSYPPAPGPYGPSGYLTVHSQVVTQPHRSSTAHLVIAWIVAVLTVGYMLPWAIAATRNKSNTAAIALINLLLGWSLVGWVVALVMSVSSEPQPVIYVNTAVLPPQQGYGPQAYGHHPYGQQPHPAAYGPAHAPVLPAAEVPPTYRQQVPPAYGQQPEPTVVLPAPDPWAEGRRDYR